MPGKPRNGSWYVFLFCLLFTSACSLNPDTQSPFSKQRIEIPAEQVEVIDGDTIKVKINGKEETVRLLLVDTPELNHERYGKQPLSDEAKRFTAQMIYSGDTVVLEKDVDERDKYERLLAYVYVDGQSVQEALLKRGYARVAYVFVPNVKYVDQYRAIQDEAQRKGVGIWQWENYAQEDGFHKEEVELPSQTKGFVASKNSDVYHPADCYVVEQIKPENRIYFATEEEAKASGRRRSKVKGCWEDSGRIQGKEDVNILTIPL